MRARTEADKKGSVSVDEDEEEESALVVSFEFIFHILERR